MTFIESIGAENLNWVQYFTAILTLGCIVSCIKFRK